MKRKIAPGMIYALMAVYVYILLYGTASLFFAPNSQSLALVRYLGALLVSLFATVNAGLAWHAALPEARPTWRWLSLGMALWMISDAFSLYHVLRGGGYGSSTGDLYQPSLGPAVLGLLGFLALVSALVHYLVSRRAEITKRRLVFALVVGGALPTLIFGVLVALTADYMVSRSRSVVIVSLARLALEVVLAMGGLLALTLMVKERTVRLGHPWFLIAGALAVWSYADVWYLLLNLLDVYGRNVVSAFMVDLPRSLAYILIGVGCAQAFMFAGRDVEGHRSETSPNV
jgi:hypothetical protein